MDIFKIMPKGTMGKLPHDKRQELLNDHVKRANEKSQKERALSIILYVFVFILFVWGVIYNPLSIARLIFLTLMITAGGRMAIYGYGHHYWAPHRVAMLFSTTRDKIEIVGFGVAFFGLVTFMVGLVAYLLLFTPANTLFLF